MPFSVTDGSVHAFDTSKEFANFGPGPAPMPSAVLREVKEELLNYQGTGQGVLSMSHRSPEFGAVLDDCIGSLRRVLKLPAEFEILFTHGGGHGQFAAIPLNMAGPDSTADFVVAGTWAKRAAAEASKYCKVNIVADGSSTGFDRLPAEREWKRTPGASFLYICSNETVNGLEYRELPTCEVPLVVDMSSDICSHPLDWTKIGVAFACAPKNIGHAGLTVVVVRRDLLDRQAQDICPGVLNWRTSFDSGLMWNTVPTFNIYTTGKVVSWIEREGGLEEMERRAVEKSSAVYRAIDESQGFYSTPCARVQERSRMNIPFRINDGDEALTKEFLLQAHALNMSGFRTNTPFGFGTHLRASMYTGTTVPMAHKLAALMAEFARKNSAGSKL